MPERFLPPGRNRLCVLAPQTNRGLCSRCPSGSIAPHSFMGETVNQPRVLMCLPSFRFVHAAGCLAPTGHSCPWPRDRCSAGIFGPTGYLLLEGDRAGPRVAVKKDDPAACNWSHNSGACSSAPACGKEGTCHARCEAYDRDSLRSRPGPVRVSGFLATGRGRSSGFGTRRLVHSAVPIHCHCRCP